MSDLRLFMSANHDSPSGGAHARDTLTRRRISMQYYWRGMVSDVKDYVTRCRACQREHNIKFPPTTPKLNQLLRPAMSGLWWGRSYLHRDALSGGSQKLAFALYYLVKILCLLADGDEGLPFQIYGRRSSYQS